MATITVLSADLASQIAAGEVVERPASALKELLENAMDAGATRCSIEIEGGGITRLSVLDDGHGMSEEDARLSLLRHATSKLSSLSDLESLTSYGFRGEALPSIASVSRLTIRTRRADDPQGTELLLEGGLTPTVRPAGCAPGTLVEVRDLFFNVPARRKFLRSTGTESGHLADTVDALALAKPGLALTFKRDGRLVRQWLRVKDRRERVLSLFEEELAECHGERGPLGVEAYLTRPERARTGAGGLRFLVNGRPIRDRTLAVVVAQAYGSVLERGRYPRGVVYLELPPALVDFNVHPQKLELRFADPRAVSDALFQIVSQQLARGFALRAPARGPTSNSRDVAESEAPERATEAALFSPALRAPLPYQGVLASPRAPWPSQPPAPEHRATLQPSDARATQPSPRASPPSQPADALPDGAPLPEPGLPDVAKHPSAGQFIEWASLEFVAQVRQTFLICEGRAGLYLLDQHAAAERVTFDRLRRQYQSREVASQALLFPVEVELSSEEAEFLELHADAINALGMDVELRARNRVSIRAVPRLLERGNPERLLRDLLAETLRESGRGFSGAVDLALATMACHASVRSGDPMSRSEAVALLSALDGTDFGGHCPHGRPIVSFTPWSELERKVGRR